MCLSRYLALAESFILFILVKFRKRNFIPSHPYQNYPAEMYYSTSCWLHNSPRGAYRSAFQYVKVD